MSGTFKAICVIEMGGHRLSLEVEVCEIPEGYDEGGVPPAIRVVVEMPGYRAVCSSLENLRNAVEQSGFPFSRLCNHFPGDVAFLITILEGLTRPIRNHPLFADLESSRGIALKELEPAVKGSSLIWHELSIGIDEPIVRHSLSIDSLRIVE